MRCSTITSECVCVYALGCTGLHAVKTSCRFLSSEVPQPCQAVTAPLSHQQEGLEWMCTSIIFLRSIRFLNLEQLGCVSSLWKTVLECPCLVTVEVLFYSHSSCLCMFNSTVLFCLGHAQSLFFFSINMLIWFIKSV